jgi:uncharacterized membrane protein
LHNFCYNLKLQFGTLIRDFDFIFSKIMEITTAGLKDTRRTWIDAARALAILGMIETHCLNSFLFPHWREAEWFTWLNFFNGLVAPTFLWLAGFSHGLGLKRRQGSGKWREKLIGVWRILAIAYALRLPTLIWPLPAPQSFWTVDVLHCLAITQLIALLIERVPSRLVVIGLWAMLAVVSIIAAPHAASLLTGLTVWDTWWRTDGGSLFPLLPWAGFFLGGAVAAALRWPAWLKEWWLWAGVVLVSLGLMRLSPWPFNKESPLFFWQRLGWLGLGLTALAAYFSRKSLPRWMSWLSHYSLSFYVVHLCLIEWVKSLCQLSSPSFSLSVSLFFYVFIFTSTAGLIWAVEMLKARFLSK